VHVATCIHSVLGEESGRSRIFWRIIETEIEREWGGEERERERERERESVYQYQEREF
jgi:hypothetical protein